MEKSIFPIHFEDRGGIEFERMVYAFVNQQSNWESLSWLGQTGGENGRDIWGIQNGKSYCYQCANYRTLPFSKIKSDLDKLKNSSNIPDHYFVVAGGRISTDTREKIQTYAQKIGIAKTDIWSGVEFEEKLHKEAPDVLSRFVKGEYADASSSHPDLKAASAKHLDRQLSNSYFSLKYDRAHYIPREQGKDIEKWLRKPKRAGNSYTFLILSPAGCGKTNLLCQLAHETVALQPTFLLAGPHIRLSDAKDLWHSLYDQVPEIWPLNTSNKPPKAFFRTIAAEQKASIVIYIDAINEYHDPVQMKNELRIFLEDTREIGIHVVLSCRDYYWGLFEATWWDFILKQEPGKQIFNKQMLSNYTAGEAQKAFAVYFLEYDVSAQPEGNAIEQFRHPLLLRFFCETYRGQKMGILKDVRLKNLFDSYWNIKLGSIAERMIAQGVVARRHALSQHIGSYILTIAGVMLENNKRTLAMGEAKVLAHSDQAESNLHSPYGRIIDEHLILEEFTAMDPNADAMVAFVFEEFMEYSMAKFSINEWKELTAAEICDKVILLAGKYSSFSQIFGVVLYIALMLKEQRSIGLWPALIGLGEQWERVVIEAFKKLPLDQIDDGVFQAIIDLLSTPTVSIQIEALELLKYGRLKRLPPPTLVEAVGNLVCSDQLPIRRRAINALSVFPGPFSIPLLEKAITTPMHRVTDQYVVLHNTLMALAKFPTEQSLLIMARSCGGYWHGDNRGAYVIKMLGTVGEQIITTLLEHPELLVRIGAAILLEHTSNEKALRLLEEKISKDEFSSKPLRKKDFSTWVNISIYDFISNTTEGAYEKRFIEKAIAGIKKNIFSTNEDELVRTSVQKAISQQGFQGMPFDPNTVKDVFRNETLVIFIIKAGLEYRSQQKWQVTGNYSRINVKSTRSRWQSGKMTQEDTEALKALFNVTTLPGYHPQDDGAEIRNGINDNGYYQEYAYRSWGVNPPQLGYTEYYD